MKTTQIILLIIIGIIIGFLLNLLFTKPKQIEIIQTTTDTLYTYIEVRDTLPILKYKEVVRYEVDTLLSIDSVLIPVNIPIEERLYSNTIIKDNDTISYNAKLSGFKPVLESLDFNWNKSTIYIKETVKSKENGFYFSPQLGIGYGIINNKPDIYLGFGLGYKFYIR